MTDYIPLGYFGISHKTASVEIRDQAALSPDEQRFALSQWIKTFGIDGALIVSTCNRTEIYVSGENYAVALPEIRQWLNDYKQCSYFTDEQITTTQSGYTAVNHFFNVISGMDSQILGEPQITGQIKEAYNLARDIGAADTQINKLYDFGMRAQKMVRTHTFLSEGAVSVSFAGVELARKIFNKFENKSVLLIGAGETAELAAIHFKDKGIPNIRIVNRTESRAKALAEKFDGKAYPLSGLNEALDDVDIVISATSSKEYILTTEILNPVCKKRNYEPIFIIDLAMPRDIDPEVENIDGVFLYNLDNLNGIVQANLEKRKKEIPKAQEIIDESIAEFKKWMMSHSMASVIGRIKKHFDSIRQKELDRLRNKLPNNGMEEIEYLTQSIMNKVMHQHIKMLKKSSSDLEKYQEQVELFFELYEVDGEAD
ncbi:MAG: glutamyl-tRNA reductase [Calditrichaceae bacterium]|nr:glutamyl-tRNA reductase [Calditrichaceae bacterium]